MMRRFALVLCLATAGCFQDQGTSGPTPVFPDLDKPDAFSRMYTFTENADATIRVWTQERGDLTLLFESRKNDSGDWTSPREISEFPNQGMLTEASFSPADGYLYYASNAVLPERGKGQDPNIWRVQPTLRGWGAPSPLPDSINTGASELGPTMDREGRLYFTSNHSRGRGGHDLYEARYDEILQDWVVTPFPGSFNTMRQEAQLAVTPDGSRVFFYSYAQPKLGFVDIWTASRGADGTWLDPVNLGPSVNTDGPDLGPSVSVDGKTLYFSRDGQLMSIPMSEALKTQGWIEPNAGQ